MGILLAGSEEIRQRYLPELASGEAMFSYALSEPGAGSDAASITTRATRDGDGWRLNGAKRWISNAGVSRYYTVMAVTDPDAGTRGISMFVVHGDDEGFSLGAPEQKMGIKGSPTRELYFDDVRLGDDRLVGPPGTGFATALRTLDHTRPTIAAQAVGVAQGALDFAVGYVKERKQFGRAVAEFQGLQFMLADMGMALDAARLMTYAAAAKAERGDSDATYFSAAAKTFASDTAMKVTTDAVQLLGGYGYVKDYPVERMMRDAKITQIYEGTNQIQRVVMARNLLSRALRGYRCASGREPQRHVGHGWAFPRRLSLTTGRPRGNPLVSTTELSEPALDGPAEPTPNKRRRFDGGPLPVVFLIAVVAALIVAIGLSVYPGDKPPAKPVVARGGDPAHAGPHARADRAGVAGLLRPAQRAR